MESSNSGSSSSSGGDYKLWDRLGIEEDPEPFWYLINCVAGLEMDLLRQCRYVCQDMPPENVVKFVVPTERKTRSHGANRMLTETKSKYPGYVFAKIRLCPEVYEAIQGLDLCRSWMGTVQEQKGLRKLPPSPVALNELEIESFGLENPEWLRDPQEDYDEEDEDGAGKDGIILDEAGKKPKKNPIDQEALKVFLGLQVNDMVKVTAKGRFYNQDATVRRLKEGKILLRFFTYGTMFEEWMDPTDVRKLTELEILNGLKGPTRPITQEDMDRGSSSNSRNNNNGNRPGPGSTSFGRGDLMQQVSGNTGPRNRRQDRVERGQTLSVKRDIYGRTQEDEQTKEATKNWERYKDQKRSKDGMISDNEFTYQPGSRQLDNNNANNNNPRPFSQREDRRTKQNVGPQRPQRPQQQQQKQDWSSFVSPGSGSSSREEDDFFASLMNDLSRDAAKSPSPASAPSSGYAKKDTSTNEEDDFFASLVAEMSDDNIGKSTNAQRPFKQKKEPASTMFADDFFASLASSTETDETEYTPPSKDFFDEDALFGSFDILDGNDESDKDDFFGSFTPPKKSGLSTDPSSLDDDDDFFASLGKKETTRSTSGGGSSGRPPLKTEDFFASLESTLSGKGNGADDADDFFASLEEKLSLELQDDATTHVTKDMPKKKPTKAEGKATAAPTKRPSKSKTTASDTTDSSKQTAPATDFSKLTVPALKEMLRAKGMKVSGNKAELIDRLTA